MINMETEIQNINKISDENWKNLLLGLVEKLDITYFQLLEKAGICENSDISFWISGKLIPSLNMKLKFMNFLKGVGLDYKEIIEFGKGVRNSVKIQGEWISTKTHMKRYDFNGDIIIKRNGKAYLNTPFLFPEKINNKMVKFILIDNKILVFYNEKRSSRPFPLILPRYLEIDEKFIVGLSLYLGEGSRNRKPKMTNSEPIIINQSIEFFEILGIPISKLKGWLQIHERSRRSIPEVKKFWIENTNLEEKNITKSYIKKSSGNGKVKEYGVLHLETGSILLQYLIEKLLSLVTKILDNVSIQQHIYFLQGEFAAEGSVNINKYNSLSSISFTSTKSNERDLIEKLLNEIGIEVHRRDKEFGLLFHGFYNLKKAHMTDIFKYHPERKMKMEKGLCHLSDILPWLKPGASYAV